MEQDEDREDKPGVRIGVSFRDLNVYGLNSSNRYQPTMTSYTANLIKSFVNIFRHRNGSRPKILKSFNGLVRSGEMLLVLGRPGSGCSTLLKALSGEIRGLHIDQNSKISYDGEYLYVHWRGYHLGCSSISQV